MFALCCFLQVKSTELVNGVINSAFVLLFKVLLCSLLYLSHLLQLRSYPITTGTGVMAHETLSKMY